MNARLEHTNVTLTPNAPTQKDHFTARVIWATRAME